MKNLSKILIGFLIAILVIGGAIFYKQDVVLGALFRVTIPGAGGTGTSTPPDYGDVLVGNSNGTYDVVATSTLAGGMQTPWLQNINANGYTLNGSSTASGTLTLMSTSHATKGKILFGTSAYDEVNNRLGIGTASPTTSLHVEAATSPSLIVKHTTATSYARFMIQNDLGASAYGQMLTYGSTFAGTSFGIASAGYTVMSQVGSSGNGLIVGTENNKPLIFGTNSLERIRILAGGDVGIGTVAPNNKLHVAKSGGAVFDALFLENLTGNANDETRLIFGTRAGNNKDGAIGVKRDGSNPMGIMTFYTSETANTPEARMTILSGGNVGIGITAPTSRIHGVTTLSAATGDEIAYQLNYTTNKATSGNDTGLLINQTDTASPGTSLLIDAQVGGVSKASINNVGLITGLGGVTTAGGAGGFLSNAGLTPVNASALPLGYSSAVNHSTNGMFLITMAGGTMTQTSGTNGAVKIYPTYNQSGATSVVNTDLLINRTETSLGTTPGAQLLIDAQVGGVSKFKVDNTGLGYFASKLSIGTTTPTASFTVISQTATTTIDFGDYASTTNKTCFNVKTNTGTNASFYFTTSGQVFENNLCR